MGWSPDAPSSSLTHFAPHPVSGPPPPAVIGTIAPGSIARHLVDELDWALTNSTAAYAVLNACRAWRFATDGAIVSKLDGAAWALDHGAPTEIVHRAVQAQLGENEHHVITPAVTTFVHGIQSTFGAASANRSHYRSS